MNTSTQATPPPTPIEISPVERAAAARYISAIVAHDQHVALSGSLAELRTRQLWAEFEVAYAAVATGPYARRGDAALRTALGRL